MAEARNPLLGPSPVEVPLANAPLVRVIGQVRFPLVISLQHRDFVAPFQEAIRQKYPVLRQEGTRSIELQPDGNTIVESSVLWRFHDAAGAWRVTLGTDFLALETTRYNSRSDFLDRFQYVLEALQEHVELSVIDRVGLRFIDRIAANDVDDLHRLIQPQVVGVLGTALAPLTQQAVAHHVFHLPDENAQMSVRWGSLPPNVTFDPAAIEAIEAPSWVLDIDAFVQDTVDFELGATMTLSRALAERIYSVFRWVITDEFLKRYGG